MTPFNISCPDCGASLKITDPSHVGKSAKCPKCRTWLQLVPPVEDKPRPPVKKSPASPVAAKPPAKPVSRPAAKPKPKPKPQPVDDFEDDYGDDFASDEFDDLPLEPEPLPKAASKPKKKKKTSRKKTGDSPLAKIGSGIAVVLVILVIGLKVARPFLKGANLMGLFDRASGIGPDLTWLPDGVDVAGEIRVADMLNAPSMQGILSRPEATMGVAMMTGMMGVGPQDIESIRFGVFASPNMFGGSQRFGGVVRLSKPGTVGTALENATQSTPAMASKSTHGSRTIYSFGSAGADVCCLDEQTIVFGSPPELRGMLDKEGRAESTSRFGFLDKERQFSVVIAPPDPDSASGFIGTTSLSMFKKSPMTGMSFCADFDTGIHGAVVVNSVSSQAARDGVADFDRGLKQALNAFPAVDPSTQDLRNAVMATKAESSGKLIIVAIDLPGDTLANLMDKSSSGPGMLPMPTAPSFSPSGMGSRPQVTTPKTPPSKLPSSFLPEATSPAPDTDAGFGAPAAAEGSAGFSAPAPQPAGEMDSPFKPKGSSPFVPKSESPAEPMGESPFKPKSESPFKPKDDSPFKPKTGDAAPVSPFKPKSSG